MKGRPTMKIHEIMHYEYMPTKHSMAAQMYDVKKITKQKYEQIRKRGNYTYPYKVLQTDGDAVGINTLLSLYTNDMLKNIAYIHGAGINVNVRKELLIQELFNVIISNFKNLLETMNDVMYYLLLEFTKTPVVTIESTNNRISYALYLVQRGFLFRNKSDNQELLLMPDELRQILVESDKTETEETEKRIKRNTAFCNIGKGILYYYGVLDEFIFSKLLFVLVNNYQQGMLDKKVKFSEAEDVSFLDMNNKTFDLDKVIENFIRYSEEVHEFIFNDYYHRTLYGYYSVFDPVNVYYNHQHRQDIDFFPLSCNELLAGRFPDEDMKDVMYNYLTKKMGANPINTHYMVDEWGCYEKNGEHPHDYLENITGYINFSSLEQLNEMLSFSMVKFCNNFIKWTTKGHTPNGLAGNRPEQIKPIVIPEQNKPVVKKEQVVKEQTAENIVIQDKTVRKEDKTGKKEDKTVRKVVKTGRNEPCPCGSGKKYKKCCG